MRREGVAQDQGGCLMRRRLASGLIALTVAFAVPAPALSRGATADGGREEAPKVRVAGIEASPPSGAGAIEIPRLVRPGSDARRDGNGDSGSSRATRGPLAPIVAVPAFDGLPDAEIVSPGDPTGALGVTYHLAAVNIRMAFYDRAGVALDPPRLLESLDSELPGSAEAFDPKVVYDPYRQHFILVFLSATATQTFITVLPIHEGEEDTPDNWCPLHMSGDQVGNNGKQFADYPMVGFTENRVTLTTNQFDFSNAPAVGDFVYSQVISIRKTQLYDCAVPVVPIKVFSGPKTRDPDGSHAFTIVPAVSFGGSPTVQYMTSLDFNGSTGKLILWRLRIVNGVLKLGRAQVGGGSMDYPPWGRQCPSDNTGTLNDNWDTGDLRLTTSFWDGGLGRLYTATSRAGNIGGDADESVIRWWEVDPASALADSDVTRSGTVGAAGRDVAWPSIATDGDGKIWINYARAGTTECLAAYASVVQVGSTASAPVLIASGVGRYEYGPGFERWGDYTAIARDPVTPTQMATYGAYPVDNGIGGAQTDLWQQVIASVEDA